VKNPLAFGLHSLFFYKLSDPPAFLFGGKLLFHLSNGAVTRPPQDAANHNNVEYTGIGSTPERRLNKNSYGGSPGGPETVDIISLYLQVVCTGIKVGEHSGFYRAYMVPAFIKSF